MFVCPGCQQPYSFKDVAGNETGEMHTPSGLHMLAIYNDIIPRPTSHTPTAYTRPFWHFIGSTQSPTLTPSILSKIGPYSNDKPPVPLGVCHSYLTDGVFHFLSDCTHGLADQHVPLPDIPHWAARL